ncbi:hypothetical protein KCU78_g14576, partial [Aureobasidium melanogenum]
MISKVITDVELGIGTAQKGYGHRNCSISHDGRFRDPPPRFVLIRSQTGLGLQGEDAGTPRPHVNMHDCINAISLTIHNSMRIDADSLSPEPQKSQCPSEPEI